MKSILLLIFFGFCYGKPLGLNFVDPVKRFEKLCAQNPSTDDTMEDPNDCSKYYECNNGQVESVSCPEGFFYDEEDDECYQPTALEIRMCSGIVNAALGPRDLYLDIYDNIRFEYQPQRSLDLARFLAGSSGGNAK
uniref:Chitin-binding type-2 domain-containing protein n=2 Tax=Lutzomyia longipalpis TaxID=7200 RepID=A0A1B0CQD5_LUTLO